MDFILEFLLTFWVEMAMKIMPRSNSKKAKLIAKIIIILLVLYVIVAFNVGNIMLVDECGSRGVAIGLIITSVMIFISQIILGIAFYTKRK